MHRATPTIALLLAATAFGLSVAKAQVPQPQPPANPQPPKNLQFFPKDIPRPQLIANMRSFSRSLGVQCGFCHAGIAGQPSGLDFASDAKEQKVIARKMLAMVHRINEQDLRISDPAAFKVTCFTCHRGAIKPLTAPAAEEAAKPVAAPAGGLSATKRPERGF